MFESGTALTSGFALSGAHIRRLNLSFPAASLRALLL